jgi:hypothetical protein
MARAGVAIVNHDRCWRARRNHWYGRWECAKCGEPLAWGTEDGGPFLPMLAFPPGIERRPQNHDGVHAFGLGNRARRGKLPRASYPRGGRAPFREAVGTLEIYVYCPRPECAIGQHVVPTVMAPDARVTPTR